MSAWSRYRSPYLHGWSTCRQSLVFARYAGALSTPESFSAGKDAQAQGFLTEGVTKAVCGKD